MGGNHPAAWGCPEGTGAHSSTSTQLLATNFLSIMVFEDWYMSKLCLKQKFSISTTQQNCLTAEIFCAQDPPLRDCLKYWAFFKAPQVIMSSQV